MDLSWNQIENDGLQALKNTLAMIRSLDLHCQLPCLNDFDIRFHKFIPDSKLQPLDNLDPQKVKIPKIPPITYINEEDVESFRYTGCCSIS